MKQNPTSTKYKLDSHKFVECLIANTELIAKFDQAPPRKGPRRDGKIVWIKTLSS